MGSALWLSPATSAVMYSLRLCSESAFVWKAGGKKHSEDQNIHSTGNVNTVIDRRLEHHTAPHLSVEAPAGCRGVEQEAELGVPPAPLHDYLVVSRHNKNKHGTRNKVTS